ncbi:hypothetical protein OKJ48_26440 [Streptomyces kunmingensis]|uniref:ABC transporter permease n=1 Tax=Streptomyces kunmingensis TaxID=68225 RepID=A0ABU6CIP7_9ACTN|nr:hypothetical protein [Streptomyces kunmingensis]MEB3963755.1 hypothetical protein [Streptomyces kunmingensis]
MADTTPRTTAFRSTWTRRTVPFASPATGRRHPLVATAMVLPLAALLVVVFGGWDAVVTQASSVGVMLGR